MEDSILRKIRSLKIVSEEKDSSRTRGAIQNREETLRVSRDTGYTAARCIRDVNDSGRMLSRAKSTVTRALLKLAAQ